jgi:hypothetical protein
MNFAACRNVFGHSFSNNWINGSLYHFPFRNLRFFKSLLDPVDPNGPYNEFCKDTILLHEKTNNFYYRSSPYNGTSFIGKQHSTARQRRNEKEILFPNHRKQLPRRKWHLQFNALFSMCFGVAGPKSSLLTITSPGHELISATNFLSAPRLLPGS